MHFSSASSAAGRFLLSLRSFFSVQPCFANEAVINSFCAFALINVISFIYFFKPFIEASSGCGVFALSTQSLRGANAPCNPPRCLIKLHVIGVSLEI